MAGGNSTFADEQARRDFLREIEQVMREGRPEEALAAVRERLALLPKPHSRLVRLATSTDPSSIGVSGWEGLSERFTVLGGKGRPVTALGVDLSWPGHVGATPNDHGCLAPHIETNYYSDASYRFSEKDRMGLLEGYSTYGSEWQGCFEDIDDQVGITGLDALYGAVQLAADKGRDDGETDDYHLASATAAILVHLAVKKAVREKGLPHRVAVLVGSNEDYPFFDAPVCSSNGLSDLAPSSLNPTIKPQTPSSGLLAASDLPAAAGELDAHPTGSSLRRALISNREDASAAPDESATKVPGLFAKLFSRRSRMLTEASLNIPRDQ